MEERQLSKPSVKTRDSSKKQNKITKMTRIEGRVINTQKRELFWFSEILPIRGSLGFVHLIIFLYLFHLTCMDALPACMYAVCCAHALC